MLNGKRHNQETLIDGAIQHLSALHHKNIPHVLSWIGEEIYLSATVLGAWRTGQKRHINPEDLIAFAQYVYDHSYLSWRWVRDLLDAGGVPFHQEAVDRICSDDIPETGRVRAVPAPQSRVPPPPYTHFVARHTIQIDLIKGLRSRSGTVVLYSQQGGVGKTSLIINAGMSIRNSDADWPSFDRVVFFTDQGREGSTTLDHVLDTLALRLGYPHLISLAQMEKQNAVENLLAAQRILVILDNAETIKDTKLLAWIQELPVPSKALVTTRASNPDTWKGVYPVRIEGMHEDEAAELINERTTVLKLSLTQEEREKLIHLTSGNPLAIVLILGHSKEYHTPLDVILQELQTGHGDLAESLLTRLFLRSWQLLDRTAHMILMAATPIVSSASVAYLTYVAQIPELASDRDPTLARYLRRLTDLGLLIQEQPDRLEPPRYAMHPLVRAFMLARMQESSQQERVVRERWVHWYCDLAEHIRACWNNILLLNQLDPERHNLEAVAYWAFDQKYYHAVCRLARGVRYYLYVRGRCHQRTAMDRLHAQAAAALKDPVEETRALANYAIVAYMQFDDRAIVEGEPRQWLERFAELLRTTILPASVNAVSKQALAYKRMREGAIDDAYQLWHESYELSPEEPRRCVEALRGMAECKRRSALYQAAQQLYTQAYDLAHTHNYARPRMIQLLGRARTAFDELLQPASAWNEVLLVNAEQWLAQAREDFHTFASPGLQAEIWNVEGRRCAARSWRACLANDHDLAHLEHTASQEALQHAIELYERMGMRWDIDETKTFLETSGAACL